MLFGQKTACHTLSMAAAAREMEIDAAIRLIDVRTEEEYREGHIPGSLHIPLNRIAQTVRLIPDQNVRLFVYCLSGARSGRACAELAKLGYTDVTNIGGITQWPGRIESEVRV